MKAILTACVRCYQLCLSPLSPPRCRYHPTCSQYALEAIERFGALRGSYLAGRRLLRCHPFARGELFDPVPETFSLRRRRPGRVQPGRAPSRSA